MLVHASASTDLMVPSLRALSRLGADIERRAQESGLEILGRHGLAIDSFNDLRERVPHQTAVALLDNAVHVSGDPAFAVQAGRAIERGDLGVFQLITASAPTLRESIRVSSRYLPLVHDGAVTDLVERGEQAIWRHQPAQGVTPSAAANEYVIALFFFGAQPTLGFTAPPVEIWMMHRAPAHRARCEQLFGAPVRYGRSHNAIVLPRAALELPLVTADAVLLRVLQRYADALLTRGSDAEPFAQRVRDEASARLQRGAPLGEVADALHMSESSLQRRLQGMGTTDSEIGDGLRRERALSMLQDNQLNISEIAFALGFAHPPAFHRAFKRWYDCSPSEHRAKSVPSEFYRFYRGPRRE